jgi:acyl carrier protein
VIAKETFFAKLAEALQVQPADVHDGLELTGERWDSVAQLETIAAIDELYGVTVPTDELVECKSVRALLALVERYAEPS